MKFIQTEKNNAAKKACSFIKDKSIIGLGTGSTAYFAIHEVASLIQQGYDLIAVATSKQTFQLASQLNIPLIQINEVEHINLTIDGTDEFDNQKNLIKGGGGALFKEKIVALKSKELYIITDSSKQVPQLGKFKVPIEIVPFAEKYVSHAILKLGGTAKIRMIENKVFLTDQNNPIVDADFDYINDPETLSQQLNQIDGIICHGLFVGLATKIFMGQEENVIIFE